MEGGGAGGGLSLASTYRPGYVSVPDSTVRVAASAAHRMPGSQTKGLHQPIQFPLTRAVLWDHRNTGPSAFLHPAQCRNPALILEEKTLRLAHRFAEETTESTYTCSLLGSVVVDCDGEGVGVTVDRFHPAASSDGTFMPEELFVPCQVEKNSSKPQSSVTDYISAIEQVGQQCGNKAHVDLSQLLAVRAYCSYHANRDNFIFHMDFDLIMPKTKLKVTPVNAVPIMATALSKNLSGPMSMSGIQGEAKSGYLSMDQTRKLLLVLESDPKVSKLPLVGVWISGVSSVQDPFVWANCLRYLFNSSLQERVCGSGSEPFLIVLYSTTRSQPEFYECIPSDGKAKLDLELRTCHEVIQLPRLCLERAQSPLELELIAVESGQKLDQLHAAMHSCKHWLEKVGKKEASDHLSGSLEDMMPRASPAPHRTKAPVIRPTVPEVSLLLDENIHNRSNIAESPQSLKSRPTSRAPIKPVNRVSSASVPASPTVTGTTATTKRSVHSSPNSPNVPQGQWTNQPAGGVHMGAPAIRAPRGAPPMTHMPQHPAPPPGSVPGHMYPSQVPPAYRQQPWPYQQQVYSQYPQQQQQMYAQHPNVQPPYGYMNIGPPHSCQGYAPPQVTACNLRTTQGPQGRGDNRAVTSSNAASHGSHLPIQAPCKESMDTPTTRCAANTVCACCSRGDHVVPNGIHPTQTSSSATITTSGVAVPPQWPSPIMPEKPQVPPQPVSASPEAARMQAATSPDNSPGQNTTADSGLHTLQSTQSRSMDSTQPVSPDVYALLRMQDEQLKMLREQLSQLLAKQSGEGAPEKKVGTATAAPNTTESATQSSKTATPQAGSMVAGDEKDKGKQTCSIAINTSLWWPNAGGSAPQSNQTDTAVDAQSSFHSQSHNSDVTDGSRPARPGPVRSSHCPQRTGHEEEGVTFSNETLSLGEFQLTQQLDRTQESMVSEMIVDMPAYTSLSPDKSGQHSSSGYGDTDESNRSPMLGESVSMYQQEEIGERSQRSSGEDTGLGESQPDASLLYKNQKQFYANLMGNVQKLLGQSDEGGTLDSTSEHETTIPQAASGEDLRQPPSPERPSLQTETTRRQPPPAPVFQQPAPPPLVPQVDVGEQTKQQLLKLGINLNELNAEKSYRLDQTFFLDSAMLPKINYVSMMLDRDSDTSADADALSMKYLSDEQLSELARLRLNSSHNAQHPTGLDRLVGSKQGSTPEVTAYGLPANHMSFATKKYMERYGLTQEQDCSANSTGNITEPDVLNVRDFLKTLADRSLELSRQGDSLDATLQASPKVAGNCYSRDSSMQGVPLNYYSDGESFHIQGKPSSTPADRRPSVISDTTPNRTPQKTPLRHPRVHARRHAPSSDTTPIRVFENRQHFNDSDPSHARDVDSETQQKFAAYLAVGGDAIQQTPKTPQQKPIGKVLDIERLKELPKLL